MRRCLSKHSNLNRSNMHLYLSHLGLCLCCCYLVYFIDSIEYNWVCQEPCVEPAAAYWFAQARDDRKRKSTTSDAAGDFCPTIKHTHEVTILCLLRNYKRITFNTHKHLFLPFFSCQGLHCTVDHPPILVILPAAPRDMNLKSIVRLDPYFDDEKCRREEDEGRSRMVLVACMILLVMTVLGSWLFRNWLWP